VVVYENSYKKISVYAEVGIDLSIFLMGSLRRKVDKSWQGAIHKEKERS
jgi:hypothetical protein